jgi:ABC-type nitrate/sulfonate/bicarbonate transport system permease component
MAPTSAAKSRLHQHKWGWMRLASPIVLLAVWQLGSALGLIPQDVLPAPSLILEAGVELIQNGQLADALRVSGIRVVEGLVLGNARDFLRIDIIIFGLIVYALLGIGTDAIVRELEHRALRHRS